MVEPTDARAIADLESAAGLPVLPVIAPASDIRRSMDKAYRALAAVGRHIEAFLATEALHERSSEEQDDADAAPVVQVVNLIIQQGVRDRASDIHIEPQDSRVRVRYRIDGALHDVLDAAGDMGPAAREPHQDHGRHEHRRAPPPAGRPDRDGGRRRARSTSASRPPRRSGARRSCCGCSTRAARCFGLDRARHARGDAHDVLEADPLARSAWSSAPARPAAARPRRSTRRSREINHDRAQRDDHRGPGRVRLPVDQPDPDQRAGRHHLRRRAQGRSCARTPT